MITFSRISTSLRIRLTFASAIHTLAPALDPVSSLLQLLSLSTETHSLKLTHQAHAQAHRSGLIHHPLIAQKLIFSYSNFKQVSSSKLVYDSLPIKNSYICNSLLNGYKACNLFRESFELFREMCRGSDLVDDFTVSLFLKVVGGVGDVVLGKMVHGRGLKTGIALDAVVGTSLISVYLKCGCFGDALKVFDGMPHRRASSWNAMLSGYVKKSADKGVNVFGNYGLWEFVMGMQREGLEFDAYTVSTLLSLCGEVEGRCVAAWNRGRELHCYVVKNALDMDSSMDSDVHLGCCLVDMYSKNGKLDSGRRVFEALTYKNVFAWTAMINGCVHCGAFDKALYYFREMQWRDGMEPNEVSLVTILPACNSVAGLMGGKQIHGFAVRRGLNHELSLSNALIDTYSKCGSLSYATGVFYRECIHKDAVSWTSMISGYGLHGQGQHAVSLFTEMLENGIKPDATIVVCVLSACCRSGLFTEGTRIYDTVVNNYDIEVTLEMCACMVEMLGQSGQLDKVLNFIKNMPMEPGPSIWGSLLSASQLHGNSDITELAYKSLINIEPDNASNYISLSNMYASSKRWDVVANVRKTMREKGLKKSPGCSWISIHSATHSFYVADKSHPCADLIYATLNELFSAMQLPSSDSDFVHLLEVLN